MIYDLNKHRYILTPLAVSSDLGINLDSLFAEEEDRDTAVNVFLNRTSRELYSYIYKMNLRNKDKKEYVLSLPQYRESIKEALEEFIQSLIDNQTDVNLYFRDKNNRYDRNVTDALQMTLDASGLTYSGDYWGIPIDYKDKRGIDY